jgi:phospholipid transport system substrate-binding protein
MRTRISTTSKTRSEVAALCAALVVWLAAGRRARGHGRGPRPTGAKALIEKTVAQVLVVLRDDSAHRRAQRASSSRRSPTPFDFRTMARLVLRATGSASTAAKRDEFVDQFTTYLANDYGRRIERYEQEDVKVLAEQPKPRGDVEVRTKIVGGKNNDAIVDYRMRKGKDGSWRIIDVVIEGISLVANFRDQFREVIARGGPEALLQKAQGEERRRGRGVSAPVALEAAALRGHLERIERDGFTIVEDAIEPALVDELADDLLRLERALGVLPAHNAFEGTRHRPHLQPARARSTIRDGSRCTRACCRSSRVCSTPAVSYPRSRRSASDPARRRSRSTPTTW